MKKFLLLFLGAFLFVSAPVASAVGFEIAENVVITQNILDDTYVVAGNATIESEIFGDLYVIGGNVTINNTVHEDLVVLGGRVVVTGDVTGDLRIGGGQVAVYGNVGDDVLIGGGQVDIGKSSVIGGSLISGAGILTVEGEVKEDIRGGMGMLILNGIVGKDVIVTIEDTMSISDSAVIGGHLKYSALLESTVPPNVVRGEVAFNQFERETVLENLTYIFFISKVLSLISALILALFLVLLIPKALTRSAKITKDNILKTFGVGLLTMIVAFIAALILLVTIVGISVGLVILAILSVFIYFAKVFVSVWLASYVFNFKKKISHIKLFGMISLALLAYYLIGLIPFVGWAINAILFLVGIGAIVLLKIEYYQFLRKKNMV
jgi:hypothetical protein